MAAVLLGFALFAILSPGLEAQYFGRNKVQYKRFDFKIIKTKHFDVYYYPEFKDAAQQAARMAERWYARLSRVLNHELKGRQPLILYSSSPHFQQTTTTSETISEGTGGFTEAFKRRIVLPVGSSPGETDHVIGHELVHAFQYDIASLGTPGATAYSNALQLPLWFIEGMSEYLSIGPVDAHTAMWMRDATQRKELPAVKKLDNPYKYFPYRYGQAMWSYITGRWGDEMIPRLVKTAGRAGDLEAAITRVLGVNYETLTKDWHQAYKDAFEPLLAQTQLVDPASKALFKGTEESVYNISPSLSPDGRQVIFLSTRDLFSIDLYLADALSGKIKKKITETAVEAKFESLQFIKSTGCWDPQGKKFVFGAVSNGEPNLTVFDAERERIVEEIEFRELDEIFSPTWSPDGRMIAFSSLTGGKTDLYVYNLETKNLRQLTDDFFGDLHPAWSPDGSRIAFVTDRFTTDLSLLSIGDYELALIDPESGQIERVEAFSGAKNINPQWSPDSRSLYFISDQSGKSDIYRIDLGTKRIFQVTNLFTGVSGITDLSPAISVAQESGRMAYSAFDQGKYSIFAVEPGEPLLGKAEIVQFGGKLLSVLPPREQPSGALLGLLKNPLFGLPEQVEFAESSYKPKLTLDYVAPPQVGVGVDRFGTYTGGGVGLFWTDMLGYHTLGTVVQSTSRFKDLTGILSYQNSQRRLNWGGAIGRIPYVFYGGYGVNYGIIDGQEVIIEQEDLYWQINYQASVFLAYPFNQVRRVEVYAGFQYIDFDREYVTYIYDAYTGTQLYRDTIPQPSADSISFAYTTLALVYDSALFGATAPIIGQSYILEYTPTIGSLRYHTFMADYRKYVMPAKPFTLAFRALHYGRYGRDADDPRLWPLYLGYETFVRGYDYGSFTYAEFEGESFDQARLFGSKILVGNLELRFPLFRVLGIGKGFYGILPVDMVAFYDWGVAWGADVFTGEQAKPVFLGGTRKAISSGGLGLRMNVFGYLVVGVNYVKPFDRSNKGWYFQFSFWPGF